MTDINTMKLSLYQKKFGEMTSEEALHIAIEAEQFCKDCGPHDQAYQHFSRQKHDFEKYALILEGCGR